MPRRLHLGLLRTHDFRQLFTADTLTQIGQQVTLLALPLVAINVLDASKFQIGVLTALETLPFLLFGLPAGAWVDRMRRRPVLVVSDVVRAFLLASIPIAWWLDMLRVEQLYVVGFLTGIGTVFFDVAYQSYLPHLVGREQLVEGNTKLEVVRATSQLGGPSMAGGLVQLLTAPFAIAINAVTYALSAFFLGRIRKREEKPERKPDAHLGREIWEGLRFVLSNRLLRSIAGCTATFNLLFSMANPMILVMLADEDELALPAGQIGVLLSIGAVGGLLGAFLVRPVVRWLGQGPTIWISAAVTTPFALLVPMAQRGWSVWVAAVGYAVMSLGIVVYNVTQVSFRQGLTPERLLGRMNASMRFLVWGTMPIGGFVGGALASWIGVRPTISIGVGGACLSFLWIYLSPLRTMRELPTEPEPATAPEPEPVPQA